LKTFLGIEPPAGTCKLAAAMNPVPSPAGCLSCGVCCHSLLPTFVRLTGEDWAQLGAATERVAHFIGHRAYMKMGDGHCAALRPRPGPAGATEYFCTVYADRPQVCRDLGRGSPQCLGELATKGGRPDFSGSPWRRRVMPPTHGADTVSPP
jgi:hypothetical protein